MPEIFNSHSWVDNSQGFPLFLRWKPERAPRKKKKKGKKKKEEQKEKKNKTKRVGATLAKTRKGTKVGFSQEQAWVETADDSVYLDFSSSL